MNAEARPVRHRRTVGFGTLAVAAALLTSACAAGRVAQTLNQHPTVSGVSAQIGSIAIRNLTVEAPPQGVSYPKGSALRLIGVFVNNGASSDLLTGITSPSFTSWGSYSSITSGDQVVAAAAASAAGSPVPSATSTPAPLNSAASPTGSSAPSGSGSPTSSRSSSSSSSSTASSTSTSAPASATPTSSAPTASRTVRIPADSRISYGVPDATGSLLALNTKSTIYPGSAVSMTLTFAGAGTITVQVPVNITTDPSQSVVPSGSG